MTLFSAQRSADFDETHDDEIIYQANTEILYNHLQPSQKNNISQKAVERYIRMIEEKKEIKPILISSLQEETDLLSVRLADGRHRLSAYHNKKIPSISVKLPTEVANEIAIIFPALLTSKSDRQESNKPLFQSRL